MTMEELSLNRELPLKEDQSHVNQPELHKIGAGMVMDGALVTSRQSVSPIHLCLPCFHCTVAPDLSSYFTLR